MTAPEDRRWATIRKLEADLERIATAYGLDCRGWGFTAICAELADNGWRVGLSPAQLHTPLPTPTPPPAPPAPKPAMTRQQRITLVKDYITRAAAAWGFSYAEITTATGKGGPGMDPVLKAAKIAIISTASCMADDAGFPLIKVSDLGRLMKMDRTMVYHYRRLAEKGQKK